MKKLFFALTVLALALVFQSCEKDSHVGDIPSGLQVPEIPPAVLYTIPTYEIANEDSLAGGKEDGTRGPVSMQNWLHAGISLLVWNAVVVVNLAVPVSAIAEAFNHDAVYIGNNTYAWSYTYTQPGPGGSTYAVVLTGQYISNEDVEWKLKASEVGGFQNFEWVTAVVATNHTEAEFTIHRNPENPEPYLRINSTYQPFDQNASVRLTNVIANDPGFGHYIEYGADNANDYNRSFELYAGASNTMMIEWNEPQRYGRVMHEAHFGDSEWHCWDSNYLDVDCN
jgi:hypothetical protein